MQKIPKLQVNTEYKLFSHIYIYTHIQMFYKKASDYKYFHFSAKQEYKYK